MTAAALYHEASRLGLLLERRGTALAVSPRSKCPPEFMALLRAHKSEVLALLEGKGAGLPDDQAAWLYTAFQVVAGEFIGADASTRESLIIGLRSIGHPLCRQAVERLLQEVKDA